VTCQAAGSGQIADTVSLQNGAAAVYHVTIQVPSAATDTLVNTATAAVATGVTDPVGTNDTATDTDVVAQQANLNVSLDDGVETYLPGGTLVYTLVVGNRGASDAPGSVATFSLPDGMADGASWSCAATADAACHDSSGTGALDTSFDIGESATVTFQISVPISSGYEAEELVATATVDGTGTVIDPDTSDNKATDSDQLTESWDLGIEVASPGGTYTPGASVAYEITVTNGGPSDVSGAKVTDELPHGFGQDATWTCVPEDGSGCGAPSGTGDLDTTADVAVGGKVVYTLLMPVPANWIEPAIHDMARVEGPYVPVGGVPAVDTDDDVAALARVADIGLALNSTAGSYTVGLPTTYQLTVTNYGPSDVSDVVLTGGLQSVAPLPTPTPTPTPSDTDTGPAALAQGPLAAAIDPIDSQLTWTCQSAASFPRGGATPTPAPPAPLPTDTMPDGTRLCPAASGEGGLDQVVALPYGGRLTYTLTLQVPQSATGALTLTYEARVPHSVTDPVARPSTAQIVLALQRTPGLRLSKAIRPETVDRAGQRVQYQYTLENDGSVPLVDVTLNEAFQAPATAASFGPVTCGNMANGSVAVARGQTVGCTGTYTATAADIGHATITSTTTATAQYVPGTDGATGGGTGGDPNRAAGGSGRALAGTGAPSALSAQAVGAAGVGLIEIQTNQITTTVYAGTSTPGGGGSGGGDSGDEPGRGTGPGTGPGTGGGGPRQGSGGGTPGRAATTTIGPDAAPGPSGSAAAPGLGRIVEDAEAWSAGQTVAARTTQLAGLGLLLTGLAALLVALTRRRAHRQRAHRA
jgi:hypothetical protein